MQTAWRFDTEITVTSLRPLCTLFRPLVFDSVNFNLYDWSVFLVVLILGSTNTKITQRPMDNSWRVSPFLGGKPLYDWDPLSPFLFLILISYSLHTVVHYS